MVEMVFAEGGFGFNKILSLKEEEIFKENMLGHCLRWGMVRQCDELGKEQMG